MRLLHLLDLYLQKLPALAFKHDVFYWQESRIVIQNHGMRVNLLESTSSTQWWRLCAEAGISQSKTNNSLRVSGATSLYSGGVPEQEIQQRTDHRSLEALRRYERTTKQQNQAVSNMLASSVDLPYDYHLAHASGHTLTTQCAVSSCSPLSIDLHTLFSADSGTLNIAPQGNFIVSIHSGHAKSETDEFDALIRDANFDF